MDRDQYRFQKFISDISGQDIKSHENNLAELFSCVRDWLRDESRRRGIPSASIIKRKYSKFRRQLPKICGRSDLDYEQLNFNDYAQICVDWLET